MPSDPGDGDSELIAFGDESHKPLRSRATGAVLPEQHHYVVAAMMTFQGDLSDLRHALDGVAAMVGRALHYRDLSAQNRLAALDAVAAIEGWEGFIYETAKPFDRRTNIHHVRAKLLEAALPHLHTSAGVRHVVLETRDQVSHGFDTHDAKDHRVLQRLIQRDQVPKAMRLQHRGKAEPMLAVADLLAGARTDHLCAVRSEPFALIAHRVTALIPVRIR